MTRKTKIPPRDFPPEGLPRQRILGAPPSKSNSYEIMQGSLVKTWACVKYEKDFFMQCDIRHYNLGVPFRLTLDVYYADNRRDLDNSLKIILDCLQGCQVIENDRLCTEIHARKLIDKKEPRIEFTLEPQL